MKRFFEIDILRGLAVIGMIVFHVLFALTYSEIWQVDFFDGSFMWWLGVVVRNVFIFLVGVSLALSYRNSLAKNPLHGEVEFDRKQMQRGLKIFTAGLLFVTLPSLLTVPEAYIRFGVLHFIGLAILLSFPFVRRYYWLLFIALIGYPLSLVMGQIWFKSDFYMIFGFKVEGLYTFDLFPIFPWISLVSAGVLFGHWLYLYANPWLKKPGVFGWIGQKSLQIYLGHALVLFGAGIVWKFLL